MVTNVIGVDYLQRAARHIASSTDVEQAYAIGATAMGLHLMVRMQSCL